MLTIPSLEWLPLMHTSTLQNLARKEISKNRGNNHRVATLEECYPSIQMVQLIAAICDRHRPKGKPAFFHDMAHQVTLQCTPPHDDATIPLLFRYLAENSRHFVLIEIISHQIGLDENSEAQLKIRIKQTHLDYLKAEGGNQSLTAVTEDMFSNWLGWSAARDVHRGANGEFYKTMDWFHYQTPTDMLVHFRDEVILPQGVDYLYSTDPISSSDRGNVVFERVPALNPYTVLQRATRVLRLDKSKAEKIGVDAQGTPYYTFTLQFREDVEDSFHITSPMLTVFGLFSSAGYDDLPFASRKATYDFYKPGIALYELGPRNALSPAYLYSSEQKQEETIEDIMLYPLFQFETGNAGDQESFFFKPGHRFHEAEHKLLLELNKRRVNLLEEARKRQPIREDEPVTSTEPTGDGGATANEKKGKQSRQTKKQTRKGR